ncbi:MAG TPA: SDR family NAD(P)-dependent oxidoreductase, partial [Rhodanobacter sp.]|nr:SDR family NAD(P)-dependent oxidoreductase [Rhodanobacter sp.]
MNPFSLQGKVALVSGANTGLGQAMAIALAEAGAAVAAVGRTDPADTAHAVRAAGRRFHWVEASLDTTTPIPAIIEAVERELGGIDILVNNAGTIRRNDALDFSEDDWDAVMGVNLKTVFFLSQAVARRLVERKRPGKIVNIASMLSFQGGIRVASYTASKSGL